MTLPPISSRLFRAHSKKYLKCSEGIIENPNLTRKRSPRDMPMAVHEAIGKWFVEKYGIDYRSAALFCTGDYSIALGYKTDHSEVIELQPEMPYSICYSNNCKDLFGKYLFDTKLQGNITTRIDKFLEDLNFIVTKDQGLIEAAGSGNEVMVAASHFKYRIIPSGKNNG